MMALLWRPGEVLLARAPNFVNRMYSALAGFVEAGESIEQCLHREVAAEVGVRVDGLRYHGSQSWPFPNSLMIAFTACWTAGTIVPQPGEIADAQLMQSNQGFCLIAAHRPATRAWIWQAPAIRVPGARPHF